MKSFKFMFKWLFALAAALSLTACGGDDGGNFLDDNGGKSSRSIELLVNGASDDVSLSLGQQAPIKVHFYDQSDQGLYVDLDKVSFEFQGDGFSIDKKAGVLVGQAETSAPVSLVAKYQGLTSNPIMVSVLPVALSELQLTPESVTMAKGNSAPLSVIAMYSNGLQTPLTPDVVEWDVADEDVVHLESGIAVAADVGETVITASYGGLTAQAQVVVSDATLDSIHLVLLPDLSLVPTLSTLPIGVSEELAVIGVYSDGRSQPLPTVTFHIDGDSVTQQDGVFTSVKAGLSSITARYVEPSTEQELETPATVVSVTPAVIQKEGLSITTTEVVRHGMVVDVPLQLNAQAIWEDGSVFDVTSAAEWTIIEGQDVFDIQNNGVIVGKKAGTGTVQATFNGEVARATLEVSDPDLTSLSIDPTNAVVSVGQTQAFVVSAHYANGTSVALSPEQLSFTVDNSDIATIVDGVLSAHHDGVAMVKVVKKADPSKTATATVTVVNKTVKSVAVTLRESSIAVGDDTQALAVVTYEDGSTETLAQYVSWHSSRSDVALITDGYVRGLAEGTTHISATYRGVESSPVTLSVSGKTVDSIQLMPSTLTLSAGQTSSLTVMAVYSDKTMSPLSDTAVTWKLAEGADDNVISVDRGQVKALSAGQVGVLAEYDGRLQAKATVTVTDATLNAVMLALKSDHTLLPSSYEAPIGFSVEVVTLGVYSNGDTAELSPVTYHLEGNSVVRDGDVFTTVASGLTRALASYTDPATGKEWSTPALSVFVTGSTLQLDGLSITTPENERHNMINGIELPLTAIATWDDGSSFNISSAADWTVTQGDDVATVSSTGVVTGKKAGNATIQAVFNDKPVTTTVKVSDPTLTSLSITPETAAVSVGQTQSLVVMGHYANDTSVPLSANQFSLSVGDAEVASIEDGVLTAKQGGTTTVTATFNDDPSQRAIASITVVDKAVKSVSVTLDASTIAVGGSTQAHALVTYTDDTTETIDNNVAWHSSDSEVALVTNGYVRGLKASDSAVGISATYRGKTSAPAMLQVSGKTVERIQFTPSSLTLRKGQEADLSSSLIMVYSDKTAAPLSDDTLVTWKLGASESDVVSLNRGQVTALNKGTVTVVAQYQGGPEAEMTIEVNAAALEGIVLALKSDPTSLVPRSYAVPIEFSTQLAVVGVYTDGTRVLNSDEYVYDVTGDAVTYESDEFTAVKGGVSSITARYVGPETQDKLVTPAVEVLVNNATIQDGGLSIVGPTTLVKGLPVNLTAQALWDDGTVFNITSAATWTVTQGQANVTLDSDKPGVVTGNVPGETSIVKATYGEQEATITLTVSDATLESLSINPEQAVVSVDQTQAFVITGHYDNETSQVLSPSQFEFNTSNNGVGSIDNNGVFTAQTAGSIFITATLSADKTTSLTVPVTVIDKEVVDVKLSLDSDTVTIGGTTVANVQVKFAGEADYTSITEGISWQSTNPDVALVMNGQIRGEAAGATHITATYRGTPSNSETLTVSGKTIDNIYFVPTSLTLPAGHESTLSVMAVYSDKSTGLIDNTLVTWKILIETGDDRDVIALDRGKVQGLKPGHATVVGEYANKQSTVPVSVTNATLESIALSQSGTLLPQGIEMQIGTTLSLDVLGFYSGTQPSAELTPVTYTLTGTALESSSNGEFEAMRAGLSTIKATYLDSATSKEFTATLSVSVSAAIVDSVSVTTNEATRHGMIVGVPLPLQAKAVWNDESKTEYNITSSATWTVVEDKDDIFKDHDESSNVFVAKGAGEATVRASFQGQSEDVTLKVSSAALSSVSLSPAVSVVTVGDSQTFVVKAQYANNTEVPLSASSYTLSAQLNGKTLSTNTDSLTFTETGTATVTVSFGGKSTTADVTVVEKKVASVRVALNDTTIEAGGTTTATAYVTYEGSTGEVEVSDGVVWVSSDTDVALVTQGSIKGLKVSSTPVSITAEYRNVLSTPVNLAVTDKVVSSITATPSNITLDINQTENIVITASYHDGQEVIYGTEVTWTMDKPDIVEVSDGVVTAKAAGNVVITATYRGQPTTINVTVENPLQSLTLTPSSSQLHQYATQQFTLQAHFLEGAPKDVTEEATWTTGNATFASVDNTSGSKGLVKGESVGNTTVTATWNGEPVSADVYVQDAEVETLVMTTTSTTLVIGDEVSVTVEAIYKGDSTATRYDVTDETRFEVVGAHIGLVEGYRVQGLSEGSSQLNAYYGGKEESIDLTVNLLSITLSKSGFWYGENSYLARGESTPKAEATCDKCSHSSFEYTWQVDMDGDGDFEGSNDKSYTQESYAPTDDEYGKAVRLIATHDEAKTATMEYTPKVYTDIVSNEGASVAVLSDGSVIAWGDSAYGGVLDAATSAALNTSSADVVKLVSSYRAFSAMMSDGTVIAWGDSSYGGDLGTSKQNDIQSGGGAIDIAATQSAFAVVLANGSVIVWGDVNYQLPYISTLTDARSIIANDDGFHVQRAYQDWSVHWRDLSRYDYYKPTGLFPLTGNGTRANKLVITRTVNGTTHWGTGCNVWPAPSLLTCNRNAFGSSDSQFYSSRASVNKEILTKHSSILFRDDGIVEVMGYNSVLDLAPPTSLTELNVKDIHSTFSADPVTYGGAYAALKTDGTVIAWGDSGYGGTINASTQSELNSDGGVIDMFSNDHVFMALKLDGNLVVWGNIVSPNDVIPAAVVESEKVIP